jgi:hypothetical protein
VPLLRVRDGDGPALGGVRVCAWGGVNVNPRVRGLE